jgi:hypothetical protein
VGSTVYRLDPLTDERWSAFVASHPRASVFHTRAWLTALKRTYGYTPIAFTTSRSDSILQSGIVFCEIQSLLTGRRLVSLPFSDHCDPLADDPQQVSEVLAHVAGLRRKNGWRYVELRPIAADDLAGASFAVSAEYLFHVLPLDRDPHVLFRRFHKSSTQRKILRAQREGLSCEAGRDAHLLRQFYRLLVITRRRHALPPQPFEWFENLADCLGDAMTVRIASYRGRPLAGMITLRHGTTTVYKYGGSDVAGHPLGAMHLLFWKAIEEACASGCTGMDLGRTDMDGAGLSRFKERWGASRTPLRYWRSPDAPRPGTRARHRMARWGVDRAPRSWRAAVGRVLYKHFG